MIRYFIAALLFSSPLVAEPCVPIDQNEGIQRLLDSQYRCDYWKLTRYFDTQFNSTACGLASAVMILNALEIEKPEVDRFGRYPLFTQEETFFSGSINHIIDPLGRNRNGVSIHQLAEALHSFGVKAEVHLAQETSIQNFRNQLKVILRDPNQFVIANYCRKELNQAGSAHHSPIAAYEEKSDSVLILDVARYKYPPVWVKLKDLHRAMRPTPHCMNRGRGWIVVGKNS